MFGSRAGDNLKWAYSCSDGVNRGIGMHFLKTTVATAAVCLFASAASAALVDVKLVSVTPALNSNSTVNVSATPSGSIGNKYAVAQNYTSTTVGLDSFVAFCLDLAASVGVNGNYTYNTINEPFTDNNPFNNSYGFNSTQRERIQALFDANYATASTDWSSNASAFQLALWESGFESDSNALSLGAGVFQGADLSGSSISTKATGYLTAAFNYLTNNGAQKYALTYLESAPGNGQNTNRSQNLVTATVVPLPAAGMLLIGALGALGLSSRRKKAAAKA